MYIFSLDNLKKILNVTAGVYRARNPLITGVGWWRHLEA